MLPKTFTKEDKSSGPSQYTMSCLKKDGEKVKIRVLSDFIEGKSVWGEKDGKPFPFRFKSDEAVPLKCIGINKFNNEPNRIKQFIAAVVWNYANKQIEILEAVNQDIKNGIYDLENDEDWGNTLDYDLTIVRKGEKTDTTYSVIPSNKKPFEATVESMAVNLDALFTGENPFAKPQEVLGDNEPNF